MSHDLYSPLSYKEYFTKNIQNINTFFTNFIELLIYINLLKQYIYLLNGTNFNNLLTFLKPILEKIKFLFNIEIKEDFIEYNYLKKDSSQDRHTPEQYTCEWGFIINDIEYFNPITEDIK